MQSTWCACDGGSRLAEQVVDLEDLGRRLYG